MWLQGQVSAKLMLQSLASLHTPWVRRDRRVLHTGLKEGDKRKESAGHVAVEQYLKSEDLPFTVFQPLYIYGPHTAKDCEQWFLDRILRDRPVPIPAPGIQLVALSHVEDVASMLAKVTSARFLTASLVSSIARAHTLTPLLLLCSACQQLTLFHTTPPPPSPPPNPLLFVSLLVYQ